MASPVDFISGPKRLSTFGNLLKENTGTLIAYPLSLGLKVKSFQGMGSQHDLSGVIHIGNLMSLGYKGNCPGGRAGWPRLRTPHRL